MTTDAKQRHRELFDRYRAAQERLAELKPSIYTPALVEHNLFAASRVNASELSYFVERAEDNIARTENRRWRPG